MEKGLLLRYHALRFLRSLDPSNRTYQNLDRPVLLLGSARGGTSMMVNILGAHPNIHMLNEMFVRDSISYRHTLGLSDEPGRIRNSFMAYLSREVKRRGMRWGVKLCTHHWTMEDLEHFIRMFPDVNIVFIVRDGRDVVLSMLRRSTELFSPDACARRWLGSISMLRHLRAMGGIRLFWFRYEDMVSAPDKIGRDICGFLGEPFDSSILDHTKWPGSGPYEVKPVSSASVGKWRNEDMPSLPEEIESEFTAALREYGYE